MSLDKFSEIQTEDAWLKHVAELLPDAEFLPDELKKEIGRLREKDGILFASRGSGSAGPKALGDAVIFVKTVVVVLKEGENRPAWMETIQGLFGLLVEKILDFSAPGIILVELKVSSLDELATAITALNGLGGVELAEEISFQFALQDLPQNEIPTHAEVASSSVDSGCAKDVDLSAQPQWKGINIIDAWARGSHNGGEGCGRGVKVAVIDIGFDPNPLTSVLPVRRSCIFSGSGWQEEVKYLDSGKDEVNSHGVACAGLIGARPTREGKRSAIGAAPECELCLIRIQEDQLQSPQQMGLALWWATGSFGSEIISCSLNPRYGRRTSKFLEKAIERCEKLARKSGGSLICFASPTQRDQLRDVDEWIAPRSIVLVGSWVDKGDGPYKSAGVQGVDLLAPDATATTLNFVGKGTFLGTSASAALVAGAAALIAGHFPQLTVCQLRDALIQGAEAISGGPADWRLLNVTRALQEAEKSASPP